LALVCRARRRVHTAPDDPGALLSTHHDRSLDVTSDPQHRPSPPAQKRPRRLPAQHHSTTQPRITGPNDRLTPPLAPSRPKRGRHPDDNGASRLTDERTRDDASFSDREHEVIELLASGLTNAEIGRRIFVSERTAKFHVSSVMRKLGVHSRAEVAYAAGKGGLLDRPAR
jgi:DNA-binding CsgD family transcriptional regulator